MITASWDPIIAQIGPFQLGWHGVFTALAVVVAIWLLQREAVRRGIPAERITSVGYAAIAGGLIGARLFHVLDHLDLYLANPLLIVQVWQGGIAVYGAFLGALVGGLVAAYRLRLPRWGLLDAAAPALLVGQAIGRLGCFANGDAWGAPCDCPFCLAVRYTNANDLLPDNLRGVPTYPYPLYEIGAELLLLGLLWLLRDRITQPGQRFLIATIGYGVIRFGLTFFRQEPIVLWGLQEAQVIALVTSVAAAVILLARGLVTPVLPRQAT